MLVPAFLSIVPEKTVGTSIFTLTAEEILG
jgi:hypothetical protein